MSLEFVKLRLAYLDRQNKENLVDLRPANLRSHFGEFKSGYFQFWPILYDQNFNFIKFQVTTETSGENDKFQPGLQSSRG